MSPAPTQFSWPAHVASLLRAYPRRWLIPAVAVAVLAALYAALWPSTWEATQALVVRKEAANGDQAVGKFSHNDEMKTVQETLLELVRSRGVLEETLETVGPPASSRAAQWPTARDVEDLRDSVKLVPPKGADFGKTEIFYLKVRDNARDRANRLAAALTDQLEVRFQELRDARAASMTAELVKAVAVARSDLDESTARLAGVERSVGSDLAELRSLQDAMPGESPLQRTATEIRNELRQAHIAQKANEEFLATLEKARQAPETLVAMPNELLESQPALRRLKDGLVDAGLRAAALQGRMSSEHPLVKAAGQNERKVVEHLHNELGAAVSAVKIDLQMSGNRIALLENQLAEATGRLENLASLRAGYSNLIAETKTRTGLLERAEQQLSEARVSRATAGTASLIERVDAADTGFKPLGPGKAAILLAGLLGGLATGLGVLAITVEPERLLLPPALGFFRIGSANAGDTSRAKASGKVNGTVGASLSMGGATLSIEQALRKLTT